MSATPLHHEHIEDAAERERGAFNAAFYELGLHLYWDEGTYRALSANPSERDRVRNYLQREQPHLLRAYDADFLTDAVIRAKQRCQQSVTASPANESSWAQRPWEEVGF
jgi:hypothetical protein